MNKLLRFAFVVFSCSVFQLTAFAQHLSFEYLTPDDGLSQPWVSSILQDKTGLMWFGTNSGLNKFDGTTFTQYYHNPADGQSISADIINDIYEDKSGNLWIASLGGISLYNRELDVFMNYQYLEGKKQSLGGSNVMHFAEDSHGKLWLAIAGFGVSVFDPTTGTYEHYVQDAKNENSLSSADPRSIFVDEDDIVWVGTVGGGLNRIDPRSKQVTRFYTVADNPKTIPDNTIYTIVADLQKNIWFGTLNNGICKLVREGNNKYSFERHKPITEVHTRYKTLTTTVDTKGNLWIGTENGGLDYFNTKTGEYTNYVYDEFKAGSLNSNSIHAVYLDRSDNFWVGTYSGGINVVKKNKKQIELFKKIPGYVNSLPYNNVSCFFENNNGDLWIGTDGGGVCMIDGQTGKYTHFNTNNSSMLSNAALCIAKDSLGYIWIGGWECGLNRYDPKTKKLELFEHSKYNFPNDNIFDIVCDAENQLWIAFGGVGFGKFNLVTHETKIYSKENIDIISPWAIALDIDKKGNIVMCNAAGISIFDPKLEKIQHKTPNPNDTDAISSSLAHNILVAMDGDYWISTGSGLNRYNTTTQKFEHFFEKDGLSNNSVQGIIEDKNGKIWVSTDDGITKFDPKTKESVIFKLADGLQGKSFIRNACCKLRNGSLLFGGANGYNKFHPDSLRENPHAPTVVFTGFSIFNKLIRPIEGSILPKHISMLDELILTYKESVISFEYVALDFTAPEKNSYAYKLDGFDKEWNYVGNKRTASYTNLDAGKYILRVKAANNDGVWNEKGISIQLIVLPPWWKTFWFRLLSGFVVLASIITFYKYRVHLLKLQKRKLEQKVKERTSDLHNANNSLLQQQEEILAQSEELALTNNELNAQKEQIATQNKSLEKALENMQVLSEFGKRITSELDSGEMEKLVFDYVSKLMDTTTFGVGHYNATNETVEFRRYFELAVELPFFEVEISNRESLIIKCFNNRELIVKKEEDIVDFSPTPNADKNKILQSYMLIPLVVENRALGVLLVSSVKVSAYNNADILNLQTLASYVAVALDNAQAYRLVNSKNEAIEASIRYAQTIQTAILPKEEVVRDVFEHFTLFKPRDVVSGDFYWAQTVKTPTQELFFLAAVDCTGHGVPGAFMSLISSRILSEIVLQDQIYEPNLILKQLDIKVQITLNQEETESSDGMDVCLCVFEKDNTGKLQKIRYSGAKRPLLIYRAVDANIEIIEADRLYIGRSKRKNEKHFTVKEVEYKKGDVLYLSSDGMIDQNNKKRQKFGSPRLLKALQEVGHLPMEEQNAYLDQELMEFMGKQPQRDDITILGVRIV